MNSVNTNIVAMKAATANSRAFSAASVSMTRLTTGQRINSAADDAAGLSISTSMTAQIRGMSQAVRNAADGVALAQTAQGALTELTNILQRMRELTVQAMSGTYSADDRSAINKEAQDLRDGFVEICADTNFNGVTLLQEVTLITTPIPQTWIHSTAISISIGEKEEDVVSIGPYAYPPAIGDFTDPTQFPVELQQIDASVSNVTRLAAKYGAFQNRLESAMSNLTNSIVNLSDARSRIADADYAAESVSLAKQQILQQASSAMLAQAQQKPKDVLALLKS